MIRCFLVEIEAKQNHAGDAFAASPFRHYTNLFVIFLIKQIRLTYLQNEEEKISKKEGN